MTVEQAAASLVDLIYSHIPRGDRMARQNCVSAVNALIAAVTDEHLKDYQDLCIRCESMIVRLERSEAAVRQFQAMLGMDES